MGESDGGEACQRPTFGEAPAQSGAPPTGSAQAAPAHGDWQHQRAAAVAWDRQPGAAGGAATPVDTKPKTSRFAGVKVKIKEFGAQPSQDPAAAAPAQPEAHAAQLGAAAVPPAAATAPPEAADAKLPTVAPSAVAEPAQATAAVQPEDAAAARGPACVQQQQEQQSSAVAASAPAPPLEPGFQEEQHTAKPQWRRGFKPEYKDQTAFLFITLTPSDCSTKRLRPPRERHRHRKKIPNDSIL